MEFLFNIPGIVHVLGFIMSFCYGLVENVGVAIILFTIIVRILMFPISVKQQKTTSKSQIFAPKLKEIQTKYRGNQQRMQEEMQKLQKQGYNPAGGCLPMIATMLILFGVLGVVYKPMTYFESIPKEQIAVIQLIAVEHEYGIIDANEELSEDEVAKEKKRVDDKYKRIQSELELLNSYKNNKAVFAADDRVDKETVNTLNRLERRIVFMGIDFSQIPALEWPVRPIFLIPILSFLFASGQMIITQIIQKKTSPESLQQMGSMKYMLYFMPILSLVIAFQFPAGAGFYWALSSAVGILQSLIIYKLWPVDKLKAEVMAALEKKGYNVENVVVIEKSDGKKTTKKESEMSSSERKEYNRKKLEEARKADLEKYGEVGVMPPKEEASEDNNAKPDAGTKED